MNLLELDFERAKAKHILFKTRLRSMLYGAETDESSVTSHHECEVGKWIYNHALEKYGDIPEMHDLEKVHHKIHDCANELINLYKNGEVEKAREGLTSMEFIAGNLTTLLSVVEVKVNSNNNDQNENGISDQVSVNYKELLQLHEKLVELDERVKTEIENAAKAKKQEDNSESKFRNTMMQAPVGMIILRGRELIVEMANATYLEIVDKTEEDFVGKSLFDSLPEVKDRVNPILQGILTTGIPYYGNEFEVILRRSGIKETCYFNFVYQPLLETDGAIGGIIVVATEVTQQVKAKKALQQSETRFRNLVAQSQFAKAIFEGEDMVISLANEAMLKDLWKRELKDVQGKKLLDVFPELIDQKFPQILKDVYFNGITYRENEAMAFVETPEGPKIYYLDFQYAPIHEIDGSVSGVMVSVNNVTEKVEARQQVNDAVERLRLATEGTQLGTWDLNLKTRQVVYSPRLSELFGQPETKVLTHWDLRDQIYAEDKDIIEQAYKIAFKTGIYYYEARVEHPDHSLHWVRTQGKVIFDQDGKPHRMLGTMMDISKQKEAEKIIEESEKRYKDLIETLPVAVYTVDADGLVNLYNKAAVKLWGREPELGKDLWCGSYEMYTLDGEFLPHAECPMGPALREKRSLTAEAYVKRPDGTLRHVIANPQPIFDSAGNVTGALNVVIDITDRKEVEFALKTSEGKFRTLADSMPQFIWTADIEGNLNYFNRAVFDYSGLKFEQIQKDGWLQMVHPDDRGINIQLWSEAIGSGKEFVHEHRFRKFDGEYRWQLSRAIPQKDTDGVIQMWVGTSTDIHDSKLFIDELEAKVQQRTRELTVTNDELIRTNIELGQFAYVASHDLQEPLRKIQTFATRIMETEKNNLSDRGKDYFNRMQASSTRMQQLIVDLLAFSRANAVEKNFEHTDLNLLLQNVQEQLNESIQQKGAIITSTNLPSLNVIVYQFEQLFTNLITNSLKFVKNGVRPEINITAGIIAGRDLEYVEANPENDYHYLSFSDNGIGFDPQFKERIFQVFQRLHNKNSYEGTGIGLAICKKIVDNHLGIITAISNPDEGATFIIYIPVA
ncbi:PAS domain S-box protein [Dyadobacter subterraneus]|uniref:histidine kinase n=1 Tax=Dyadobacter subterraneus TaxID=2773304 RepID=A0ABR9WGP9_9BACT|nr:PAS domain S-box protein [Dyadobacter subterraneus]MBE9464675.1 PAS domain S-box protein [Dyadobacter subterraneus]